MPRDNKSYAYKGSIISTIVDVPLYAAHAGAYKGSIISTIVDKTCPRLVQVRL